MECMILSVYYREWLRQRDFTGRFGCRFHCDSWSGGHERHRREEPAPIQRIPTSGLKQDVEKKLAQALNRVEPVIPSPQQPLKPSSRLFPSFSRLFFSWRAAATAVEFAPSRKPDGSSSSAELELDPSFG